MTSNGSVPTLAGTTGGGPAPRSGQEFAPGSGQQNEAEIDPAIEEGIEAGIEVAERDQAFRAELATMGLIPGDEATDLPAAVLPTPDMPAVGPDSDRSERSVVPDPPVPRAPTRAGNARRAWFTAGPRAARAGRALGFALRRTLLEPSLAADVRRDRELATGLRATSSGCRRVLVLSARPGCGQTSVAALLALTLSRVRDDRVAAVDADSESCSLASLLDPSRATTAGEILAAARRTRQGGALPPRLGPDTPLTVLRLEGHGAEQIEEAMQALLTVERGVAVTVVDPGFSPGVFLLDTLLADTNTLVVVAPASSEPHAERLLGVVADRGHKLLADNAITIRSGERATVRRRGSPTDSPAVLPLPRDDSLSNAGVLDLAALRPGTRRAVTTIALAVMAGRSRSAAPAGT